MNKLTGHSNKFAVSANARTVLRIGRMFVEQNVEFVKSFDDKNCALAVAVTKLGQCVVASSNGSANRLHARRAKRAIRKAIRQ
jgi:hypothetical protein